MKHLNPLDLDAYSGWNTSSNSLGCAIAFSTIVSYYGKSTMSEKFLSERIYDDLIYQANIRPYLSRNLLKNMGLTIFDIKSNQDEIERIAKDMIMDFASLYFKELVDKYPLEKLVMPWNRMFEVDVCV